MDEHFLSITVICITALSITGILQWKTLNLRFLNNINMLSKNMRENKKKIEEVESKLLILKNKMEVGNEW